jgi:hypothetical protein
MGPVSVLGRLGCCRQPGHLLGHGLFQILHPMLSRRLVERLRAAAEPMALQAGDQ